LRKESKVSLGQAIAFYVVKKYKVLSPCRAQNLVIQPIGMALLRRLTAAQIIFFTFVGKYSTVVRDEIGKWARRKFNYRRRNFGMKSCFAGPIDGNNKRTLRGAAILGNGALCGGL
jgi:hypothetical protein